jgi:hypothetical protein
MYFLEQLSAGAVSCLVIAAVLLYGTLTLVMLRRRPDRLWIPALFILVLATLLYWQVYDYASAKAWFPKLILSICSAADLFFFKVIYTFGNMTPFFNLLDGVATEGTGNPQVHLILLQGLYICAIWTTSILLVHFLAGRLVSRIWLLTHAPKASAARTHVFLGVGRKAVALARSLPSGERVIFVEEPSGEALPGRVSILNFFRGVKSGSSDIEHLKREMPHAVLLKARKSITKCTEGPFFEELGLKRLEAWGGSEKNCFYLLSDKAEENLAALHGILPVKAQVYYHAKRIGAALKTDQASDANIHIIDSSFLATNALKGDESLYPVKLVEIGRDADGEPAGYVSSPFQAMVCGFGESGQGALAFLYEFGTFVDKDGQASPFHCDVVDADMDRLAAGYKAARPALDDRRLCFIQCDTESESFRELLGQRIGSLNYVFISLGEDSRSINLAIETLEKAFKCRPSLDNLLIVVKMDKPDEYRDMTAFFNDSYGGREIIRTIGDVDKTWTWDNVSKEGYLRYARRFQASYSASVGDGVSWDMRERKIWLKPGSELAHRMELRRKTEQDFANYFHVKVKAALCPARLWQTPYAAYDIPIRFEGKHYTGNDAKTERILEKLAILEHLRWTASHEISGYSYGKEKREDLMTHPDMRPYATLDEETRHYDWIVVRTTLNILAGQNHS